jgi:uncharacterized membrane protein
MWTINGLKERAKIALVGTYWKAVAISLILSFALGGSSGGSGVNYIANAGSVFEEDIGAGEATLLAIVFFTIFGVVFLIGFGIKLVIGFPLEVGARNYFIQASKAVDTREVIPFNTVGIAFKKNVYINVIKTQFFRNLFVFLWTLCFIIPGIIFSYVYAFVPYILAENPGMPYRRALELSKQMTEGEKMEMFFLDLSFILWWLLGCITCFIGFIFVAPYYNSTYAELYHKLKEKVIEDGVATSEEFGQHTL